MFCTTSTITDSSILTYQIGTILTATPCNIQVNYFKNYITCFILQGFPLNIFKLTNMHMLQIQSILYLNIMNSVAVDLKLQHQY